MSTIGSSPRNKTEKKVSEIDYWDLRDAAMVQTERQIKDSAKANDDFHRLRDIQRPHSLALDSIGYGAYLPKTVEGLISHIKTDTIPRLKDDTTALSAKLTYMLENLPNPPKAMNDRTFIEVLKEKAAKEIADLKAQHQTQVQALKDEIEKLTKDNISLKEKNNKTDSSPALEMIANTYLPLSTSITANKAGVNVDKPALEVRSSSPRHP